MSRAWITAQMARLAREDPMTGEMAVMDAAAGDVKVTWDSGRPAEVASARAQFDALKDKGYLAYKVDRTGDRGEILKSFDPSAERIIMAPRMVGG